MNIDMRGTNIIVQIAETKEKPEIIKQDEYCNIVSDKDAQIVKITANNGTKIVKEGDIVSIDTVALKNGYNGDAARTHIVGKALEVDRKQVEVTKQAFFEGIKLQQKFGIVKKKKWT